MTEIAQLLESALENNRTGLRRAAMKTLSHFAEVDPETTLAEVLDSEARDAIRQLTLEALAPLTSGAVAPSTVEASREERVYRVILEALASGPMTIGRLAKTVGVESDELRGYLSWMRQKGKIVSTGRARATRYALA